METKDFALKVKAIEDGGQFTAIAAVYGVEDLQGDVIEKGAFTRAIAQQGAGYPLLWSHKQDVPIGLASLTDGERGPLVNGTIDRTDPEGEIAYQRARKGVVRGLSIGFTLPNGDAVKYEGATRHIHELRLHELSLVSIPAQPGAQILEVRSLGDAARVIGGFDAGRMGGPELAALRSIELHVKRLLAADAAPAPDAAILRELRDLAKLARAN